MIEWVHPMKGVVRSCGNDIKIVVTAKKDGKKMVVIYFNDDVREFVSSSDRVLIGYDRRERRIYFATPEKDTVSISYKISYSDGKHSARAQFTLPKNWPDEFIVGEYTLRTTGKMTFVNLDEKLDV